MGFSVRAHATTAVLVAALLSASAVTSFAAPPVEEAAQDYGPDYLGYIGGHIGWSYTNVGLGPGLGYGVDAGVMQRYDTSSGSAYAGIGAFFLGADPSPGAIGAFGAELLLRYRMGMLAMLVGAGKISDVSGVPDTTHLAWGARLTWDYPIMREKLTIGPGVSVLLIEPNDNVYVNYAGLVAFRIWW